MENSSEKESRSCMKGFTTKRNLRMKCSSCGHRGCVDNNGLVCL